MLRDEVEQHRVDGGPDGGPHLRVAGRGPGQHQVVTGLVARAERFAQLAHVVHRHDHLQLELLAHPCVDDRDRARPPLAAGIEGPAAEEAGDLVEWALRGGEPDALEGPGREPLEPLKRQREMGAALGGCHRVDLVDDHVLDRCEHLAGVRGEHQVQRLGCGDEDVGRVTCDVATIGL